MTIKTFNRHNLQWPELKIFFHLNLFLTKLFKTTVYLVKGFYEKNIVFSDFSIKK